MNRSTVPLTRALVLALTMLTACRDAPVAPPSARPHASPATHAAAASTLGASTTPGLGAPTGEVQYVGPGGVVRNTLTLPARGPAPDIDGIIAWGRAQQAAAPRFPLQPRGSILTTNPQTIGAALLDAKDLAEVQRLLAPNAAGLVARHETSLTAGGRTRVGSTYGRGGHDIVRFWLETGRPAPVIVAGSLAPRVAGMGAGGGIVDDPCSGLTGDWSGWPAECVPGYDPAFQPSSVEPTIGSMYASLAAMDAGVSTGDPRDDGRCASAKATYYASIGAFLWSAGAAMFWAYQKNPGQMAPWIQRSWVTLGAVNIAYLKVRECLSREF